MVVLRDLSRRLVPSTVRRALRGVKSIPGEWKTSLHLAWLRGKVRGQKPGSLVRCCDYTIRINDGGNYYTQYKDLFVNHIYDFKTRQPDPLIVDCGSNIGMSILLFKHLYPKARIVGIEPDPNVFPCLKENIERNKLEDVELVQAALAGKEGMLTFLSDGQDGGHLTDEAPAYIPEGWTKWQVPCVQLRDYLTEPVEFLKMNIEGAEWDVLADTEDHLRWVRQMVIEYHHLPGLPPTLHKILDLLHQQGFEYLLNDFDSETNRTVRPPFRLSPSSQYYLLIYARKRDG